MRTTAPTVAPWRAALCPGSRILQLWLTLPPSERWVRPSFERVALETVPVRHEPGVEVRVYSGRSGTAVSPTRNHVPVTLADIHLAAKASGDQELPASYSGFLYVLSGELADGTHAGQVAHFDAGDATVLRVAAGANGGRVVLYTGEPQKAPIVMHGPFVGESRADLMRMSRDYMEGRFPRLSELGARQD